MLSLYALKTRLMDFFWKSCDFSKDNASPNRRGSFRSSSTVDSRSLNLLPRCHCWVVARTDGAVAVGTEGNALARTVIQAIYFVRAIAGNSVSRFVALRPKVSGGVNSRAADAILRRQARHTFAAVSKRTINAVSMRSHNTCGGSVQLRREWDKLRCVSWYVQRAISYAADTISLDDRDQSQHRLNCLAALRRRQFPASEQVVGVLLPAYPHNLFELPLRI